MDQLLASVAWCLYCTDWIARSNRKLKLSDEIKQTLPGPITEYWWAQITYHRGGRESGLQGRRGTAAPLRLRPPAGDHDHGITAYALQELRTPERPQRRGRAAARLRRCGGRRSSRGGLRVERAADFSCVNFSRVNIPFSATHGGGGGIPYKICWSLDRAWVMRENIEDRSGRLIRMWLVLYVQFLGCI